MQESCQQKALVSCGPPNYGVHIAVIDLCTRAPLPEGAVGEVCVSSPALMSFYLGESPEADCFVYIAAGTVATGTSQGATMKAETQKRRFLRTGDLGFLWRSELVLTGRLKECIIVNGRSIAPQTIESVAANAAASAVAEGQALVRTHACAGFPLVTPNGEGVGLALEVEPNAATCGVAIGRAVASAVLRECGIALHQVWLLRPHSLKKTTSGKIQRMATRDFLLRLQEHQTQQQRQGNAASAEGHCILYAFTANSLLAEAHISAVPTETSSVTSTRVPAGDSVAAVREVLLRQLQQCVSKTLGVYPDPDASLHELGMDSLAVAEVAAAAEDELRLTLAPQDVLQAETIRELADLLLRQQGYATIEAATAAVKGRTEARQGFRTEQYSFSTINGNFIAASAVRGSKGSAGWKRRSLLTGGLRPLREPSLQHEQTQPLLGITGAACRLPGGCNDLQKLWRHLLEGCIAVGNYPSNRRAVLDVEVGGGYSLAGSASSLLSNRISREFGFHGPSLSVDAACASGLAALHLAQQHLTSHGNNINSRNNSKGTKRIGLDGSNCAVVGASNLILDITAARAFAAAGILSPTGRCRAFDAQADGCVRGEAVVALVLERVDSSACSNPSSREHHVLCYVKGTTVQQSARTQSVTAPSCASQQQSLLRVLAESGVDTADVCLVEAHGTGTVLGDAVEAAALAATFAGDTLLPCSYCQRLQQEGRKGHRRPAAAAAAHRLSHDDDWEDVELEGSFKPFESCSLSPVSSSSSESVAAAASSKYCACLERIAFYPSI
ncbi:uncharacterized protein LOC113146871 [Cyclospora cayetanensis]|uniref:Uncharacterized protein LOC113146871 n=1 Tax=Cyclospora cayetanensis TaxID=88456 RepID=A0A6P6RTY7_9EIME|nr:uncharacterized protein LOC113146871 [Cyclospora cayetanensis]